jgi:hypothetical protein
MSIFTTSPESEAARISRLVIESTQQTKNVILGQLRHTVNLIAESSNPQAVFTELGPLGGAILAEANALATYAGARLAANEDADGAAKLAAIVARIPEVAVDEGGNVTIVVPEE